MIYQQQIKLRLRLLRSKVQHRERGLVMGKFIIGALMIIFNSALTFSQEINEVKKDFVIISTQCQTTLINMIDGKL